MTTNTLTEVLVGGFKPEEIEKKQIEKKAAEDTRIKAEEKWRARQDRSVVTSRTGGRHASGRPSRRAPFHILEFRDFYRIGALRDGDDLITFDLAKDLISGGLKETHAEWLKRDYAAQCEESPPVEFIGTAQTYMTIFGFLYDHRGNKQYRGVIEQIRSGLEGILTQTPIMTLTSVEYNHHAPEVDRVILAGGDQGVFPYGDLTGFTAPLSRLSDADRVCKALLGVSARRTEYISQWLIGHNAFLSRPISHTPNTETWTYPVVLGVHNDSEDIYFHIDTFSGTPLPALGIRIDIQEGPEARR